MTYRPYIVENSAPDHPVDAIGTIHIVAIMVDFQADQNRFTSGNGKFNTSIIDTSQANYFIPKNVTIDPLPHDQAYFEAHLEFAKNYFAAVSGGKLIIDYTVLPKIYHLSQHMSSYAPMGDNDLQDYKLADLVRDSWQQVKANGGFNTTGLTNSNTLFVIFHAGTGRDFNFLGTSLDHTPEDIPSIFLNKRALANLLNEPNFNGFPTNNGLLQVTNSIIMPETESRLGTDISGNRYLLQFSINGLLCASIGSYLGLPDLYNTQTGASGIGRFGLMDPESFFSYLGLFPPEPSAWEKIYLGWETPFDISLKNQNPITLPAASLHEPNSIGRYRISSQEYFLVENRDRDPYNKGVSITIKKPDGSTITQHFTSSDKYFNPQYPDSITKDLTPGVVVGVSNYDWSLPGGSNSADNSTSPASYLNGGILIWHIDDAVIQDKIAEDAVNNNPDRKGVNLMEADGAQDIGKEPLSPLFGPISGGTAYDFWWKGNDASTITQNGDTLQLYQNRFSYDTHPNNWSNTGSPSFFEFYDFSNVLPVASFRARPVYPDWFKEVDISPTQNFNTPIQNTSEYKNSYPLGLQLYVSGTDSMLIVPTKNDVFSVKINHNQPNDVFDFNFSDPQQPFIGKNLILTHNRAIYNGNGSTQAWSYENGKWQEVWENTNVPSAPGLISSDFGDTLNFDFSNQRILINDGSTLPSLSNPVQRSKSINGLYSSISGNTFSLSDNSYSNSNLLSGAQRQYTGSLFTSTQDSPAFFVLDNTNLFLVQPDKTLNSATITSIVNSTPFNWPALADFNDNGNIDFIYVNTKENTLIATNTNDAVLHYFPKTAPRGTHFVGTPLIADLDGKNKPDLIIGVQDSLSYTIHAYDQSMHELANFPLYVGSINNQQYAPVHPLFVNHTLYAVSPDGDLKSWYFPKSKNVAWGSQYGNGQFNKIYVVNKLNGTVSLNFGLLNRKETYNWPNPANSKTYIRYQTKGPASIHITIITMTGRILYDHSVRTNGGVPDELLIDTQNWGNGVYYARIRATMNGHNESKLIKIAVIH